MILLSCRKKDEDRSVFASKTGLCRITLFLTTIIIIVVVVVIIIIRQFGVPSAEASSTGYKITDCWNRCVFKCILNVDKDCAELTSRGDISLA